MKGATQSEIDVGKRLGFSWLVAEAVGCARDADWYERPTPEKVLAQLPDELVSGDAYAFGPTDESGLAVGLLVENPRLSMGEDLRFRVAFRQTSPRDEPLVVMRNWDRVARVRIGMLIANSWFEALGAPFFFDDAFSSEQTVSVALQAGETRSKPGIPLCLPNVGVYDLVVVFGGRPAFSFETTSGIVQVEVVA